MRRARDDEGWILGETLVATVIGAAAIAAAIALVRTSDLMGRRALLRADAVALAESVVERARAQEPGLSASGATEDDRLRWRLERSGSGAEPPWRSQLTTLTVRVTAPREAVSVVLVTRVLEGERS
jgi:hypothetical protein